MASVSVKPRLVAASAAWMRRLALVGLLAGGAMLLYGLQDLVSLELIVERERDLRDLIQAQGRRGFLVAFALYVVLSIVPGTSGKAVVAGWLFGFWEALVMVVGALTIAGMIGFLAARHLFRNMLHQVFGYRIAGFDRLLERDGALYLLTLRLLHVPFTLVNYLSGVSAIQPWVFAWTTMVGLVPGTVVLVGVGAGLPSLRQLLEQGVISLISPTLLAALTATALMPWGIRFVVIRLRRRALENGGLDGDPAAGGRPR